MLNGAMQRSQIMKLQLCNNGHCYDSDKYTKCPLCDSGNRAQECSPPTDTAETGPQKEHAFKHKSRYTRYRGKEHDDAAMKLGDEIWSRRTEEENRKKAFHTLTVMAALGNGRAQFECGRIYYECETFWNHQNPAFRARVPDPLKINGAGLVDPDYRIATYYLDAAIRNGIKEAADHAAYLYHPDFHYLDDYYFGMEFPHDRFLWANRRKAVEYCIKGIKLKSQYCYGRLHRFVGKNSEVPEKLYTLISEGSEEEIKEFLDELEVNGFFVD